MSGLGLREGRGRLREERERRDERGSASLTAALIEGVGTEAGGGEGVRPVGRGRLRDERVRGRLATSRWEREAREVSDGGDGEAARCVGGKGAGVKRPGRGTEVARCGRLCWREERERAFGGGDSSGAERRKYKMRMQAHGRSETTYVGVLFGSFLTASRPSSPAATAASRPGPGLPSSLTLATLATLSS